MRASCYADRLRFIFLVLTLAIAALIVPMQDAYAQRDLAEKNQQVIRLYQSGQKTEAIALAEQTVAIARSRGDDKVTAILMSQLGNFYRDVGRFADAENTLKTVVAMLERSGPGSNFALAQALNNLGGVYLNQDMFSDAEKLFQRSLALYDKLPPGKEHNIMRGNGINNLAVLYGTEANAKAENGQPEQANQAYDKMIAMINEVIPVVGGIRTGPPEHCGAAAKSRRGLCQEEPVRPGRDRFAPGAQSPAEKPAAETSHYRHDPEQPRQCAGAGKEIPGGRAAAAERARDTHRGARSEPPERGEEPDRAALSNPKPLSAEDAQKLLAPDEALVLFLPGDKETYVFALTRDAFEWHTIPFSRKDLDEKVAAFRRGLDVDELNESIAAHKPVYFNLDLAYELYSKLLGPVDAAIKDKRYLAVVPSGALTSLPFHLLVTEKPPAPPADPNAMPAYRDAAWLFRRQAVSVMPSVASLKALRSAARTDHGTKPFIGFGDPLFNNSAPAGKQRGVAKTRAYNEFWTARGIIDRGKLAESLPRLEDTAVEIKNIAARLGASPDDIYLGKDASETTIKKAQLSNYRVVYFATHGLVAGQIKGVGEPALALSIPANPTDVDDGLLTSSEVAQLKLNADWVVLSACDTMAGQTPGAEALSGLARAFFYAGSRALLVSHWAVESEAATLLTTSTFDFLTKDPAIGRAEALRRAMLAYLSAPPHEENANPAYWGPFSVVGEGSAK
jgi:CHAT domain-containing protein